MVATFEKFALKLVLFALFRISTCHFKYFDNALLSLEWVLALVSLDLTKVDFAISIHIKWLFVTLVLALK